MNLGADSNKAIGTVDKLKRERDKFVAFAFASADILMELDTTGKIVFADGAIENLIGWQPEEIVNKNFLTILHDDDTDLGEYLLDTDSKSRVDNVAIRIKAKNGHSAPFIMSGYKISELQGHYYLTLSTFRKDINLADVARRDLRTGLLRKSEFSLTVNKLLTMSKFTENVVEMTIFVISGLDKMGEENAQGLMCHISDSVRMKSLNNDSAGLIKENIICFVHDGSVNPETLKNQLVQAAHNDWEDGAGVDISNVTISLDTIKDVSEEDTVQSIVYTLNKFSEQKNSNMKYLSLVDCYDEMIGETVCRLSEFKNTVQNELFDLAFQPIVDVSNGQVSHFEVLTRLRDAKAFSNPFQFIEFGENVGLISEFDMKMLVKSMKVIRDMAGQGIKPALSVNLSGYSLSSKVFMDSVEQMFDENRDICPQIMVEITESARIVNKKVANDFFQRLREMGIKCCIDDFGTGEATFEYLRNLEVDIVKIDGSYISDEAINSTNGRTLLKALGRLCHDLGVDVVGEKVENIAAANMLAECGIRYGQGYFYAKPTIETDILKMTEVESKKATVTNINDWRNKTD